MDGIVDGVHDEGDGCRQVEAKVNTYMHQAKDVNHGSHNKGEAAGTADICLSRGTGAGAVLCMETNAVLLQMSLRGTCKAVAESQQGEMQQHWATRVHVQSTCCRLQPTAGLQHMTAFMQT